MRVLGITLSLVALIFGHPVRDQDDHPNIHHMRSIESDGELMDFADYKPSAHDIHKRDVENDAHSIEKRQASGTNNTAVNGEEQVAYSNQGAVAKQGPSGQYVYASDEGGSIVQIQQHVYKSSCCYKGSGCPCKENNETMNAVTDGYSTTP